MISIRLSSAFGRKKSSSLRSFFVQVARLEIEAANLGEAQKVVEDRLQPATLALHHLDLRRDPLLARRFRLLEIFGQQLHVEHDRRQRILDLVRERTGEPRDLRVLLRQPLAELSSR